MRTSVTTDDICIGGREHLTPAQRSHPVERGYSTWVVTTHTAGTLNQFVPLWFSLRSSGSVTGVPVPVCQLFVPHMTTLRYSVTPVTCASCVGFASLTGSLALTGSGVALTGWFLGGGFLTCVLWGVGVLTGGVDIVYSGYSGCM